MNLADIVDRDNKTNKVITWKQAMRGCKLWLIKNKHCVSVNYGQWKTSIALVKKHGHVDHVGVLRLFKV